MKLWDYLRAVLQSWMAAPFWPELGNGAPICGPCADTHGVHTVCTPRDRQQAKTCCCCGKYPVWRQVRRRNGWLLAAIYVVLAALAVGSLLAVLTDH